MQKVKIARKYQYGFRDDLTPVHTVKPGLSKEVVEEISSLKNEPAWMRQKRLEALEIFLSKPVPTWGADLSRLDFDQLRYYIRPTDRKGRSWDEVPAEIKRTFDRIGVPQAERDFLAGVEAQYDSEVVYGNLKKEWEDQGIIFCDTDTALQKYPEVIKTYFGTVVPAGDNKFAALNTAVWSGGCLTANAMVYTPNPGIKSIADIRTNDRVYTLDQNGQVVPARVVAQIYSGKKPVYRFRVAGRVLEATKNHQFLTLEQNRHQAQRFKKSWHFIWKSLGELKIGDIVAVAKGPFEHGASRELPRLFSYLRNQWRQNHLKSPDRTNPDLLWLLGAWMGDGNIHWSHPHICRINFALPLDDPIRDIAKQVIFEQFGYTIRAERPYSFTIHSKAIGIWLRALGFVGRAREKRIPDWIFGLPLNERLSFLGGLLDTDGWIERKGTVVRFELANQQLIEAIKLLGISCGLFTDGKVLSRHRQATFYWKEKRKIYSGVSFSCRLSGQVRRIGARNVHHRQLLDSAPKHTFNKYRAVTGVNLRSVTTDDLGFAPIREKQYLGIRDVYDIQVEGYANFVANGIIAHNSFVYVPAGKSVTVPLQAYFRINQDRFGQFERTLIVAEEGSTVHYVEGCLPAGEQVALGDRWTNIEQVKPGDWIPTETGLLAKVKSVMTRPYHGELVVIRPISRYNTFRLTPEHPVLAIKRPAVLVKRQPRKHWKAEVSTQLLNATRPTYIPAGELREGDFLVYPKIKPLPAQEQPSKEQLRLLGYYLAEGSAYLHKILNVHVVSFSFGLQERSLVGEVKQLIHDLTGKRAMEIQSPRKHGTEVRIYSKELHDFVIEHAGKGAASKQLSAVVMAQPDELLRELVETYAAGDGNIAFRGRSEMRRLITASESLARQLQEILGRLGIYASIQFRQGRDDMLLGRHITRGDQWWVVYTYNKHMGEVRACADYFLVPIKETRREPYTGMVFNLDVEAPNSYLVRGFAVHNCTAPIYRTDSLHAAVVEVIVKKGARARYTTIQNWSPNVYNLVTKRAFVYEDAIMEWLDGNLGSKRTMKYPSVFLWGKGARGDVLSVALAGTGQHQDAGAKAIHLAPYTSSTITSKSVSHSGGKTTYRGQLKIIPGAKGAKSNVRCDALILDGDSSSETIPVMNIFEKDVTIGHEASVGRVSEDQLFYLMSRGIDGDQALSMIVNGFIEPITKELPLEYAVELNRLIRLEMEGSVG